MKVNPITPIVFLIALSMFGGAGSAQPAAKAPSAPAIPRMAAEAERSALTHTELLLSKKQFDEALKQVSPQMVPATAHVYVDWIPVPSRLRPAYRQAAQSAIRDWNTALGGATRFDLATTDEGADVLILFEQSVSSRKS